jgi:hypothetical protein
VPHRGRFVGFPEVSTRFHECSGMPVFGSNPHEHFSESVTNQPSESGGRPSDFVPEPTLSDTERAFDLKFPKNPVFAGDERCYQAYSLNVSCVVRIRRAYMAVIRAFLLSVLSTCIAALHAQVSSPTTTGDIELRIQAQDMSSGLPVGFSFQLVNTSGRDMLLPTPSIACEDPTMDGSIFLKNDFTPYDPNAPRQGSACTNDNMNHLPISERIKSWKTLHPGESLVLSASRKRLGDDLHDPGTYDFWAIYFPPAMEKDERKELLAQGILIAQKMAVSNHIILKKDAR